MDKLPKKPTYSDGDYVEGSLLDAFSLKTDEEVEIAAQKLYRSGEWPFIYHLDKRRENILNWYDFKKNGRLLEVGAGCGAVTGAFCDRVNEVTAVELSPRRADILKNRFRNKNNIKVLSKNLINFNSNDKFDYVTSIGVLEYAAEYIDSPKPFHTFLDTIKGLLNSDGELLIGIENKFGLKYWAGAPEDHTGKYFDGIEGYSSDSKVRTFSKMELENLLMEVGFTNIRFYYPYPDYKFPNEIFSEKVLPNKTLGISPWSVERATLMHRHFIFNERKVLEEIVDNKMFEFFSNSFLVIASKQ